MTLPNFLIIGAAKCGTTALYSYLKQHPQIYMSPVKEPRFFMHGENPPAFCGPGAEMYLRNAIVRLEDYQALFQDVCLETAVGEASVQYLSSYQPQITAETIRNHITEVRLIAILRQPADRAYSSFMFNRQRCIEPATNLTHALAEEQARIHAGWLPWFRYRQNGYYHANISPYFVCFPREQIRVYLYDDLRVEPGKMLREIFGFLGVDDTFMPEITQRHNVTFMPRSAAVHKLFRQPNIVKSLIKPLLPRTLRQTIISGLKSLNQTKPPSLDPELRRQLTENYRKDILKLQDLIGRDLSHWLKT